MKESGEASGAAPAFAVARLTKDPRDLEAINAIARASLTEPGFSAEKELERPWARVWAARPLDPSAPPVAFLVAWHVADELHILSVATAKEARRRGIGTALMNVALAYATENGVCVVLLEVRRSNEEARRLYRRLGFAEMGIRRGYYADNGEDAIEMMLTLEA